MARKVRVVVVCEDLLHETFVRAFLLRRGIHPRAMTFKSAPPGEGDAKQHVCRTRCRELEALRRFPGENRALIYVIDADNLDVQVRMQRVEAACRQSQIEPPRSGEFVFGFVPKWEIENWLAYLRDGNADEQSSAYEKYRGRESEIYPLAERLAERCDQQQQLPNAPPSLVTACAEYPRLHEWIKNR